MRFETKTIHAGISPDPVTGAVMTPIYQTSTYAQNGPGDHKGYEYARTQNLTRATLENNVAALENAFGAVSFGSGLAAQDAIIKSKLKAGDHLLSTNDLYGGSFRQFRAVYEQFGIQSDFIDMSNPENLEKAIRPQTKLIWLETPSNPLLKILDIKALCAIAQRHDIPVVVDNTFASPYLQNPIDLGADLILHSATKYLGGHSDVVHGMVVCKHEADHQAVKFVQNASGAVPGPLDCFLVLRGIKTLHVRMDRICDNAKKVAYFLKDHPKVGAVHYPGFPEHPGHNLAKEQMRNFGGMVSFTLKNDSIESAHTFLKNTHIFTLAESLGGVESLVTHPASMTHGAIPKVEREKAGLSDTLIRLSVGIEHTEDQLDDLRNALEKV